MDSKQANKQIDIVIPTYNNLNFLVGLLESIALQNFKRYNCFVIDDNSSDDTSKVIPEQFPWVTYIQQHKNKGPSYNRNKAIRLGSSPYIVIFDDDVFLTDPDWLSKGIEIMENNKEVGQIATMIVSGYDDSVLVDCGIYGDGIYGGGIYHNKNKNDVLGKHLDPVLRRVLGACTAGTIIRREVFDKVGGFDPKYYYLCEDTDLSLRIQLLGYDIVYAPSLVTHHYESQSMGKKQRIKQYLYNRNRLLLLLQNYPIEHALKKMVEFYLVAIFHTSISFVRLLKDHKLSRFLQEGSDYLKLSLFIMLKSPDIIRRRRGINSYRRRPRHYLLDLNRELERDISLNIPVKSVIYSITNRCNAKCPMCFQHKTLNKKEPLLTLEEIEKIFLSIPELNNIVLGGGEPFLRDDIDKICLVLIKNNNNPAITIPTNGSRPDVIYEKSKRILGYGSKNLKISLSLDGVENYHNKNRGLTKLFHSVQESYEKLVKLKRIYGNKLHIQVNTCVTKDNIDQLDSLHDYISEKMPQATWTFEPVRGSFNEKKTKRLSLVDWQNLHDQIDNFSDVCDLSSLEKLYKHSMDILNKKKQVVPCCAGDEFISIDHLGNVYPCEILSSVVNVRDIDFNINKLAGNKKWNAICGNIRQRKCFCTHFCWLGYSLSKDDGIKKALLLIKKLSKKLASTTL